MKVEKKLVALFLCMLMLAGTILSPVSTENEVRAAETTGTETSTAKKILFNERLMTGSMTDFPFISTSDCRTGYYQMILSAGHTNVISYCAPSDGFVRVSNMNVYFHRSTSFENEREFEFAITNENGKILSNSGDILVVNSATTLTPSTVQHEIKKGERLHFVFHAKKGSTNLAMFKSRIEFSIDGSDDSWTTVNNTSAAAPWPVNVGASELTEQGQGNFYYQYSEAYKTVEYTEDAKKISLNAREMSDSATDWPFVYSSSHCMTNAFQIIVSAGYTNVISYKAPEDGVICIDTLQVWDVATTAGKRFEFAVINEDGTILSNNGQLYTVDSGKAQSGAEDLVVTHQSVKQGERIYFVFHGVTGNTQTLRCQAKILFCKDGETSWTVVNQSAQQMSLRGESINNTNIAQGAGNFYYEYSSVYELVEQSKPEYISIHPIEMNAETTTNAGFPFMQKNYYSMTSYNQIIVSAGYNNIIAYEAERDGTLCIDEMKVWVSNSGTDYQAEFAVVDETGKIISNHGKKYTARSNESGSTTALNEAKNIAVPMHTMKAGERIYFVFHCVNGYVTSLRCNPKILFCAEGENTWTHVNGSDVYQSSEMTLYSKKNYISSTVNNTVTPTQGLAGFYYLYSKEDTTDMGKQGKTVGTEAEGIVTIYGTPEKGTTYCDKYIADVAGDGTVSYIDLDMLNIKKQSKINEDTETIDVRYIASVDNLSYKKVGFVFSLASSEPTVGGEKCADIPLTKVYKRLLEDKGYRKAENLYAEDGCSTTYAFAFEMLQTPPDVTVYARAYVQLNDNTIVYGASRAVTTTATGTVE